MPTLTQVPGLSQLAAPWRAACVILASGFPKDEHVWDQVVPGQSIDLGPLLADTSRPMAERMLLAIAQGLVDGRTTVPVGELVKLPDGWLRLALDALAIARGSLPID